MIDWTVLSSTFIGAVVGGGVATASAAFFASRDRPRPMFRVTKTDRFHNNVGNSAEGFSFKLVNIGNGPAHNVSALTIRSGVATEPTFKSLLVPGHAIRVNGRFMHAGADLPSPLGEPRPDYVVWPKDASIEVTLVSVAQPSKDKKSDAEPDFSC